MPNSAREIGRIVLCLVCNECYFRHLQPIDAALPAFEPKRITWIDSYSILKL